MSYEKFKRKKESKPLSIDRFLINGEPTCFSWAGDDEHPQEACKFLRFTRFGTTPVCIYCDATLSREIDTPIKPLKKCPVWAGRKNDY